MTQEAKTPGTREAAMLLLSVGGDLAAEVFKNLGAKEVQRIGAAMTELGPLSQSEVDETLGRFLQDAENQAAIGLGADEFIRNTLTSALGADKASSLIDRILLGRSSKGLETLKWMDARSVADNIRLEHPQTIAIILAYLEPDQAADVLMRLPENVRPEVITRIATLDGVHPDALNKLDELIERRFSGAPASRTATLGGARSAANILNHLDGSQETAVLTSIRAADEPLAVQIEDLIFTFSDLTDIDDRSMQALLRDLPGEQLVVAMKAADETLKEKIYKNMSQRAGDMLKEDLATRGPMRLSDVEAAQKEILATARKLADAGQISLGGAKGESYV
ncbi:MAG: flagellar motor switch protein FliG [Proteobacteria bacterium]|nr:flagellar motor switch protein FliG [Pseudomonadota bacterium]